MGGRNKPTPLAPSRPPAPYHIAEKTQARRMLDFLRGVPLGIIRHSGALPSHRVCLLAIGSSLDRVRWLLSARTARILVPPPLRLCGASPQPSKRPPAPSNPRLVHPPGSSGRPNMPGGFSLKVSTDGGLLQYDAGGRFVADEPGQVVKSVFAKPAPTDKSPHGHLSILYLYAAGLHPARTRCAR